MMTSSAPSKRFRRIVITLRSHSEADSALNAATILAQALKAELFGLFVEEEAALHSSALPFARVVGRSPTQTLSRETMLAAFEHDAVACRRMLSVRAKQARVAWQFDRVRGESHQAADQQAGQGDILLLQESYGGAGVREIIAQARAATDRLGGMILMGPWQCRRSGPVVAIIENIRAEGGIDAGDTDERILQLAMRIAKEQASRLLLFVVGETREETDEALQHAQEQLPLGATMDGYAFHGDAVAEVCHGLQVCAPSFVLLDVEGVLFRDDARAERLLRSAKSPVALLKSRES